MSVLADAAQLLGGELVTCRDGEAVLFYDAASGEYRVVKGDELEAAKRRAATPTPTPTATKSAARPTRFQRLKAAAHAEAVARGGHLADDESVDVAVAADELLRLRGLPRTQETYLQACVDAEKLIRGEVLPC
jgi:hypothetical protein